MPTLLLPQLTWPLSAPKTTGASCRARCAPNLVAAGGRYLVRGGQAEALEGELPGGRTVVVEFPTMQAAEDWYRSEEYSAIRKVREGAARANIYVVEGI